MSSRKNVERAQLTARNDPKWDAGIPLVSAFHGGCWSRRWYRRSSRGVVCVFGQVRAALGSLLALGAIFTVLMTSSGCARKPVEPQAAPTVAARHEHHAPHGGAAIALGDEAYHLELVLDAAEGKLEAYVLDGELENFVRVAQPTLEIAAKVGSSRHALVMTAVANSATGETVGDTSLFVVRADWLRTATSFDGVVSRISIRGTTFPDVAFNFPRGRDAHLRR